MRRRRNTAFVWITLLSLLVLGAALSASAQGVAADKPPQEGEVRKTAGQPLAFSAMLMQPEEKAKERGASVQVKVTGVEIVDPASVNEKPQQGQEHLHYQLDSGPIIATTAAKLSFHELPPGEASDYSDAGWERS